MHLERWLLAIAISLLDASSVRASVVPPVEQGVWHSAQVMPTAINQGDYAGIAYLLSSATIVTADDGAVLATGSYDVLAYLKLWYGKNNRVLSTYSGYSSLIISVERTTDRPWDKAYAMVISCVSGKIARIMIVKRNPSMP